MSRSRELLEKLELDESWLYYDDINEPSPILKTVDNNSTYTLRRSKHSPRSYSVYIDGPESRTIQFTAADYAEFEREYNLKVAHLKPPREKLYNKWNGR